MGELPAFDFRPSPHRPLVIMSGYSEAGRVYPHDGVRSKEETKAIQNLWMASGELFKAAEALISDVRARHPDEELRCPHMRALDDAVAKARGES